MSMHKVRHFPSDRYAPSEMGDCQRPAGSKEFAVSSASLDLMKEYDATLRLAYEAQIAMMMWNLDVEAGSTDEGIRQYQIGEVYAACRDIEEARA